MKLTAPEMTAQDFCDYINNRTTTSEVLNARQIEYWRSGSYKYIPLTIEFADEIIANWNLNDPETCGDPYAILGCLCVAQESDWLAMEGYYRSPIIKPQH